MDEFQYTVFFEAKDLTDRDKERIRRYFQKRRESGGGDCGLIEKTGENTYKISFKEKEDQERVLKKNVHTVILPSGDLCLTVRQSSSTSANHSLTQTFNKGNTNELEKIFKMDIYLMYYLRDNPNAYRILQKQLSAIDCSVQLNFDEEKVVVRDDKEKGPGRGFRAAEKWECDVNWVFTGLTDSLICYHVCDPKQVRAIQQDPSFMTEDVRVYTELGHCVVVGEVGAVADRIANLDKSVSIHKNITVVEKLFELVKEEFTREMRASHREVELIIRNGLIILEGPDNEVQLGATKLDEFMNKIKKKTVNLPTELLTFMKSSGAISRYQARFQQCLRNPVSIEIGSELVLSSLSSDALDEAEAVIIRDLKVDTVNLQGAAAELSDLDKVKEIIFEAENRENQHELRAEINFIPGVSGTRLQIVGYSENVNKLTEVLNDQINNLKSQEKVDLPCLQVIDYLDKVLDLMGWRNTSVIVKPSRSPRPCLLLSGPRCLVKEAQTNLTASLANLISDTLVLDGSGAQRYFKEEGKMNKELVESAFKVIIREQQQLNSPNVTTKPRIISSASTWSLTPKPAQILQTNLEIKIGSLENEQVNVLVVPMVNKQLTSIEIGNCLLRKAGTMITRNFDLKAATCSLNPGDVLQVDAPPSLGCSKIFFIECLPWDGVRGKSVQALGKGLQTCFDLCVQQGWCSIAFPIIGPGLVLKYPLREAIQVLTEGIRLFGSSASAGSLSNLHVVIKPGYANSEECYHEVYRSLSLIVSQGHQGIFRSVTSDLDEVTMTVAGGVKLQLIFGDITNETTDVIVNSTDFVNFNDGVCKDILTRAGSSIKSKLKKAKVKKGEVFITKSGSFPCKSIFHVCGKTDAGVIEQLVSKIIHHCKKLRLKSVAIPAICAGTGGLAAGVVAGAILQGIKSSASSSLLSLTNIRLVLIKIVVFLAFKKKAMQMFPNIIPSRVSVYQQPYVKQEQQQQEPLYVDIDSLDTTSTNQNQSVFLFLGLSRENVSTAMTKLKDLYLAQCSTETFTKEQLEVLTQDNMNDLQQLVETQGLYMKRDQSGQGSLTVRGLKDGVTQVMQGVIGFMQGSLVRHLLVRDEEDLYNRVAWCILEHNGNWERLPKEANYDLENNEIAAGIVDTQGSSWSVDLQKMEATEQQTGQTAKLKRLENRTDFTLPLYWDNMTNNESIKVVCLQSSSKEYQTVMKAFRFTVTKIVTKIERVQNIHLRHAYEALKKQISAKNNQQGGAGEKLLYHGTSQDNSISIMNTGFNRSFAGQNATSYGHGTYFAVNASYSAHPTYSRPAADGSLMMFVARVLTGTYTVGSSHMKVPPPRNNQQPHDRYDSLVDRMDNPSMFVVFHDSQAYPDYLITFM